MVRAPLTLNAASSRAWGPDSPLRLRSRRVASSGDSVRAVAPSSPRTPSTVRVPAACGLRTMLSATATCAAWSRTSSTTPAVARPSPRSSSTTATTTRRPTRSGRRLRARTRASSSTAARRVRASRLAAVAGGACWLLPWPAHAAAAAPRSLRLSVAHAPASPLGVCCAFSLRSATRAGQRDAAV